MPDQYPDRTRDCAGVGADPGGGRGARPVSGRLRIGSARFRCGATAQVEYRTAGELAAFRAEAAAQDCPWCASLPPEGLHALRDAETGARALWRYREDPR